MIRSDQKSYILLGAGIVLMVFVVSFMQDWQAQHKAHMESLRTTVNFTQEHLVDVKSKIQGNARAEVLTAQMKSRGFLQPQDRIAMASLLEGLSKRSYFSHMSYSFEPEEKWQTASLMGHSMDLVVTPIELRISALSDHHIYKFLADLESGSVGRIAVRSVRLSRAGDLDERGLKAVAEGDQPTIVDAVISLDWESLEADR